MGKPLGKPEGKPAGKRPFKPHNSDKKKTFTKPAWKDGPKKFFKQKPTEGKMTKKRKLSGDHKNSDEGRSFFLFYFILNIAVWRNEPSDHCEWGYFELCRLGGQETQVE